MKFKPYECSFGIKYNGVNYDFEHVDSLVVEDPTRTRLIRGANAANKTGIVYQEGIKEPKTWTVMILNMSIDLKTLLDQIYSDRSRVDVYVINNIDGSAKIAKNAVLSQQPQQLTVDETAESMNISLIFETFDNAEVYKEL